MIHRYAVIGAGGTGTMLLGPLFRYLMTFHRDTDWQIGVIDGDEVEHKNVARQLFGPEQTTVNKAQAAVDNMRTLDPSGERLLAIPEYLSDENIERYVRDGTTVLICVDNFPVRARIERHARTLDNVTVINGGNEESTGSCQIWLRRDGKNVTPSIAFLHDEIMVGGADRAAMTCQQVAALPGGEQLIMANMASALWMLTALAKVHRDDVTWTELHFNLFKGKVLGSDMREQNGWAS